MIDEANTSSNKQMDVQSDNGNDDDDDIQILDSPPIKKKKISNSPQIIRAPYQSKDLARHREPWSAQDDSLLITLRKQGKSSAIIAQKLQRTTKACAERASK